ncbi:hypothetical protein [Moritella sp.]|uniref:hypothetical protein n=1 Tax=Moritella sp. TaxID=78556 RepID=UPI001DB0E0A5|nr:hypothetical protein [Moritella sp.]MCJ8349006.1 hypothetical protein [Moritella sp.]NQZ41381.1 hypothetical protein [Moritella sp.]
MSNKIETLDQYFKNLLKLGLQADDMEKANDIAANLNVSTLSKLASKEKTFSKSLFTDMDVQSYSEFMTARQVIIDKLGDNPTAAQLADLISKNKNKIAADSGVNNEK